MATLAQSTDSPAAAPIRPPVESPFKRNPPRHWSQDLPASALAHIPGDGGLPIIGNTLSLLRDPHGVARRAYEQYGPVHKGRAFGRWSVALIGPEANELVLMNRDQIFSSEQGWGPVLDLLFPRGLMLLDFERHRKDRRALSVAFKPDPMRHYSGALNAGIARETAQWSGRFAFWPRIKQLTLDLAAESFIGIDWGEEAQRINQAFVDMVQASVAPMRKPLPFTKMRKGVKGRQYLVDYFTRETLRRREMGGGQDMFSQFATATREDGQLLDVGEVVDHMIFLMLAAHDTITSSATSMVYQLARHRDWQERLREEIVALTGGLDPSGRPRALSYDDLGKLELTEMAFKETLRLIPPVPSMPRRALKSFDFGGYRIPAGANVGINIHLTHHMEEHWDSPESFDPMRFTPEKIRARHKYAWLPFGGGAHMCLGLHFAYMQIKIFLAQVLPRYELRIEDGYAPQWQPWPIPLPRDGLKIEFKPL